MNLHNSLIDDLSQPHPMSARGTHWEMTSDRVMGGVSTGTLTREDVQGHLALRLRGEVRLDNDGGFVQMALDLDLGGGAVDARGASGIAFWAIGTGEHYNMHLRTAAVERPWQSYRQTFVALSEWTEIALPFATFEPHRLEAPFDAATLRRIGIVGIGRAFHADIAVRDLRFVI